MGVNKVMLLGRLGKDPEVRYSNSQTAICNFSLATTERRKDQSGNWGDHTEWHNIVVFGRQAENCSQYLKKGREVFIDGKIQTRKWQDKEGNNRYTTEVVANNVQFVGGREAGAGAGGGQSYPQQQQKKVGNLPESLVAAESLDNGPTEVSFDDDDIPF